MNGLGITILGCGIMFALLGVFFRAAVNAASSTPTKPEVYIPEYQPPKIVEKLYCLYCGRLKQEGENICHHCSHYNFVPLDELIHNLCRDVKKYENNLT
jgi:hypothetical protein